MNFSPVSILYNGAGTTAIASSTSAPAGTELGLIVRNIPSGTQNVNVTNASLTVAVASFATSIAVTQSSEATNAAALPSKVSVVAGYDGANVRALLTDSSGKLSILAAQTGTWNVGITGTPTVDAAQSGAWTVAATKSGTWDVEGKGTAGVPSGGVLSIQGVIGGQAVPVTGTISSTNPSTDTIGGLPPAEGTQIAGPDGAGAFYAPYVKSSAPAGTEYGLITRNIPYGTQAISNANLDAALSTLLTTSAFQARIPVLGQAAMAASVPVTLASNQSDLPNNADRTSTGTLTAPAQTVTISCAGISTVRFQITGTWTGTLVFEGTVNGSDWWTLACMPTPINQPTGQSNLQGTTTTNGQWQYKAAGLLTLRIRASALSAGTANVSIIGSQGAGLVVSNIICDGFIDTNNSTSALLGNGGVFNGTSLDLLAFTSVSFYVYSDRASATNGLVIYWSPDGSDWHAGPSYTVAAAQATHGVLHRRARYYKVGYTNGNQAQGHFHLQFILQRVTQLQNTVSLEETLQNGDMGTLVRSVITGQTTGGGGGYVNVKVNPSGTLAIGPTGTTTPADNFATPTDAINNASFNMVYDGSTWDMLRGDSTSGAWVNVKNTSIAVTGTFWQATQPVSAVSLPLPTGAATEATLANIETKLNASVAVTGTFWQATQPISAVALPLPTGAATEATLGSILTAVTSPLAVTQSGAWTVGVNNFPATQAVTQSGTWTVQQGSPPWSVSQSGTWTIDSISNNVSVVGTSTPSDAHANPTDALDAESYLMGWNGSTWDRLRSSISQGLQVDVTRVQGTVTTVFSAPQNVIVDSGTVGISGSVAVTNANLDAALSTLLTTSAFQARINTLGQKAMTASTPVVLASDQSTISVNFTNTTIDTVVTGSVAVTNANLDTPLSGLLSTTAFQARIPTNGQKNSAGSVPVVIANDQSAITVTSALPSDRTTTGTITALGQTVAISTAGSGSGRISIYGTWTGTFTFEGTVDGSTWYSVAVLPLPINNPPAGAAGFTSTTSSTGVFFTQNSGLQQLRVRASAWTSGTADVSINMSQSTGLLSAQMLADGWVDVNNSTTTPLGSSATFTGTGTDLIAYTSLSLFIYADVASATNGCQVQFSTDNANWSTQLSYTHAAGDTHHLVAHRRARYYRVVYVNGTGAQGAFRLQTILQRVTPSSSSVSLDESIKDNESANLTRAAITGKSLDASGVYANANVTNQDAPEGPGVYGLAVRTIAPSYGLSAFGETRVSTPYTLFDMNNHYGRDTRAISTSTTGSGTVTDVTQQSAFRLSVTTSSGDAARARTNEWFLYQAGRGMHATLTVIHSSTGATNQVRNWGLYDDNDGVMFRLSGTTLQLVRRTSTGESGGSPGSPYEEVIAKGAWDYDNLDGNGPSGLTLDVTKGNIYEIRYQWLGVGVISFFIDGVLVHKIVNPNRLIYPYMANGGSNPLTWEVINTGASTAANMLVVCANVTSQSGQDPPEYGYSYESNAVTTAAATEIPVISIRLKSLVNSRDNRGVVLPTAVSVDNTAANGSIIRVRLNPTLTGATFANTPEAISGVEVDTAATATTGGTVLDRHTFSAAVGGIDLVRLTDMFKRNARKMVRNAYTGTSDVLTVTVQRVTAANPTVVATPYWNESR